MQKIPNDWFRKMPVAIIGFIMGFVAYATRSSEPLFSPATMMMLLTMGLFKVKKLSDNYYWWLGGMIASTVIAIIAML